MLSRELFKSIKKMDRNSMERLLQNVYKNGAVDAVHTIKVTEVDATKMKSELKELLRTEFKIGDTRFSRIEEAVDQIVESTLRSMLDGIKVDLPSKESVLAKEE